MALKVKSPEDFGAGLLFIGIGLLAVYLSWDYPMGTVFQMGPGYFPYLLGLVMTTFGVVITLMSFRLDLNIPAHVPWALRSWVVLPGSLALFGLMMKFELGFVPSLMVLVVGSSLAHKDLHLRETALLAVFVPLVCVGIFVYGLGLPYRLFWWSN